MFHSGYLSDDIVHDMFLKDVKISKATLLGYYITIKNSGMYYLYNDGKIRRGVSDNGEIKRGKISSFWKRKKDAKAFYEEWKKNNKIDKD